MVMNGVLAGPIEAWKPGIEGLGTGQFILQDQLSARLRYLHIPRLSLPAAVNSVCKISCTETWFKPG